MRWEKPRSSCGVTESRNPCSSSHSPFVAAHGYRVNMLDYPLEDAAALVALARTDMNLRTEELADRAGVTAELVRSVEADATTVDPDLLRKLLVAADLRPAVPLGFYRDKIREVASSLGLIDVKVFGSTAHGLDTPTSDVDFLVKLCSKASLFALGGFQLDAERIIGFPVDLLLQVTTNSIGDRARAEAVPLVLTRYQRRGPGGQPLRAGSRPRASGRLRADSRRHTARAG